MTEFVTKRIYDPAADTDGHRVLVDRLWPRGVSKVRAALDEWCKTVSPSTELRKWFDHRAERFAEFTERYEAELSANPEVPAILKGWDAYPKVTLLYGARDRTHNEAVVLRAYAARHSE